MDTLTSCSKSATEVRKEWSETIDTAVRKKPVFIKRTHDNMVLLNMPLLQSMLDPLSINVTLYHEEDGSITGSVDALDIAENAKDKSTCISEIITALRDYADDFYNEFELWSAAPNRKSHIPYICKILSSSDEQIRSSIKCHAGKS